MRVRGFSHLAQVVRRKGSRLGFESSPLADARLDCTLLEKSVRQGCRSILARGSGTDANTNSIFELLGDLALTEDIDLDSCLVGYCFSDGLGFREREQNARSLMETMGKGKRSLLDYVTFPVQVESDGSIAGSVLEERASLQDALGGPGVLKVGLDFPTAVLNGLSAASTAKLLDSLTVATSPPQCLTVATNVLTASQSRGIIEWSRGQRASPPLLVVSTEVLRVDSRRPALLAPVPTLALSAAGRAKDSMTEATNDFKHAVDRCMTLEKHFMTKLQPELPSSTLVPLTDLCWAHVLMQTQNSVQSPEEWHYLLTNQVMPKLNACTDKLKSTSKAAGDWATLYAGMARYMFTTFATVQARRREVCLGEVQSALGFSPSFDVSASPMHLGVLAASFGSSSTVIAGCEVRQRDDEVVVSAEEAERVLAKVVGPLAREIF